MFLLGFKKNSFSVFSCGNKLLQVNDIHHHRLLEGQYKTGLIV